MAYTTIDKPTDYFETELYSGSASDVTMNGLDFQPDWVWLKKRSGSGDHLTYDSVRGTNKRLTINGTDAEVDRSSNDDELKSFNSDGWTLGTFNSNVTGAGSTCVSWNWKASGSTASNTDGSITSTVSANTTAGFSIVSYTGTGSAATVGHGLGVAPKMFIIKNRSTTAHWTVYHESIGNEKAVFLDLTVSEQDSDTYFNDTSPTSSVFSIKSGTTTNDSGDNYIAYCFAEKKAYSKFGSFTGNGSSSGTYVHLGFKPAWVMYKKTNSADNWYMLDNKRNEFNVVNKYFDANTSDAEATFTFSDFLSNGIKFRDASANGSGDTYIYMAFAENPFVSSGGIPCTAR